MDRYVKLGTLITPAKTVRCGNGKYPTLSMTMHSGLVFQDEKFKKIIASQDTSDYKVVYRNQLVISFPIDEGVLAAQRITDAGIVSPAYGIWDIDQSQVLPEFLEYALRCNRAIQYYKAKLRGSTARRRSLPTPTLLEYSVPLPDIERQSTIIDTLHRVETIIEKRRVQIQKLDDLVKSRFVEMFDAGSPSKCKMHIHDYAEVISGFAFSSEGFCENEVPIIRISNINNGKISPDSSICFPRDFWESNERYRVLNGDVLMAMSGATTGKAGINTYSGPLLLNQRVASIRAKQMVSTSEFLFAATQLPWMYDLIQEASAGCAQPNISGKQIENMPIPAADYEKQKEFSVFANQIENLKLTVQPGLDKLELLKQSLMQKYFG